MEKFLYDKDFKGILLLKSFNITLAIVFLILTVIHTNVLGCCVTLRDKETMDDSMGLLFCSFGAQEAWWSPLEAD